MATHSYYAVRVGRCPGIYRTWAEAKQQVHGYSGADHKRFDTLGEAQAFMTGATLDDRRWAA